MHNGLHFGKLANTKLVVCVCLNSDVANASRGHSVDNFVDNFWDNFEDNFGGNSDVTNTEDKV